MTTFSYQALNRDGQETTGTVEAGNLAAAVDGIRARGLFPQSITSDSDSRGFTDLLGGLLFGRKITEAQLAHFTRELADLVCSNVSLPLSLSILRDQQKPGPLKKMLTMLAVDVDGGARLSEAMANHPKVFPAYFVMIIRGSEEKGEIKKALSSLAELVEKNHALTDEVDKTRGIPFAKIFAGCFVFAYLFYLFRGLAPPVLSTFSFIFGSRTPLERIFEVIGNLPLWVHVMVILVLLFGIFMALGKRMFGEFSFLRAIGDRVSLLRPISGGMVRNANIAKFTRTLGTLIANDIPAAKSFDAAIEAVNNRAFAKALGRVRGEISEHETIVPSLERSGVFPPATIHIMATGEQAGALEASLINAADLSAPNPSIWFWGLSEQLFLLALLAFIVLLLGSMFASRIRGGSCGPGGGG